MKDIVQALIPLSILVLAVCVLIGSLTIANAVMEIATTEQQAASVSNFIDTLKTHESERVHEQVN